MDSSHVLSASATPVVLISASGLITLALYNRLSAILSRIRAFHQQKLDVLNKLTNHESSESKILLKMLDSQIAKVTVKAKTIQRGLYCLLSAVLAFLLCSLLSAGEVVHDGFGDVAIFVHVLGLTLFMAGILWAMRELTLSIAPLEEEDAYLEIVTADRIAAGTKFKIARSA